VRVSDEMIGTLADRLPNNVREMRRNGNQTRLQNVDTCAAEFDAATPIFTALMKRRTRHAVDRKKAVSSLGANPYRTGYRIRLLQRTRGAGAERGRLPEAS